MYQEVFVKGTEAETGLVTVGCAGGACEGCKASFFCTNKFQTFEVRNPEALSVKPGDRVRVFLPPGRTILSTLILFGLPLVLFAVLYLLIPAKNEFIKAFWGIGGGALGFLLAYLFFRARRKELTPILEEILPD